MRAQDRPEIGFAGSNHGVSCSGVAKKHTRFERNDLIDGDVPRRRPEWCGASRGKSWSGEIRRRIGAAFAEIAPRGNRRNGPRIPILETSSLCFACQIRDDRAVQVRTRVGRTVVDAFGVRSGLCEDDAFELRCKRSNRSGIGRGGPDIPTRSLEIRLVGPARCGEQYPAHRRNNPPFRLSDHLFHPASDSWHSASMPRNPEAGRNQQKLNAR